MGETVSTGPAVSAGPMLGTTNAPDANYKAGPSITYQGDSIPDVRFGMLGSAMGYGSVRAHLDSPYLLGADAVPAASAATPVNIAAAQFVTSGTPMTLAAASSSGVTLAIPLYNPFASSTLITSAMALDFGFGVIATTSGSAIATPAAGTISFYTQGQWLVIGNAGTGGVKPLIAQVLSIGTTTVTLSTNALSTQAAAPVGQGNILDSLSVAPAVAHLPYVGAGVAALLNPLEGVSRGWGVTGSASATGGTITMKGWDIYGQPMSETLTIGAGAVTAYGKKAFKYIQSVTPNFTDAHNYSVGTSDVFGFAVRSDRWEYLNLYVAGAFLSVSTGWTAADQTSPATATTGDVRGTIQVGTRGPLGSGAAGGPMDGVKRIAFFGTVPAYNLIAATPANPAPMYGVTQA